LNDERRQREEAVEIARGRRDDDRGEGRGSSTRSFASCGIRDDERGCGIISETAVKGDRVAFEVEVPDEVDPDISWL
jgi:hypothetical protein